MTTFKSIVFSKPHISELIKDGYILLNLKMFLNYLHLWKSEKLSENFVKRSVNARCVAMHSPDIRKATISLSSVVRIQLIMQCHCLDFCKFSRRTKSINQKKPLSAWEYHFWVEKIPLTDGEGYFVDALVWGCPETWLPFVSSPASRGGLRGNPAGNQQHHLQPPLPLRIREQCRLHLDHPGRARGHHRLSLHRLSTRGRVRLLRDQWNRSTIHMVSSGEEMFLPQIR